MNKAEFEQLQRGDHVEYDGAVYESTGQHSNGTDVGIYTDEAKMVPKYVPFEECKVVGKVSDLTLTEQFRKHLIDCNGAMYKEYVGGQFEADVMLFIKNKLEHLERWKAEQMALTGPFLEFAQNSDLFKVGDSAHVKVVELISQMLLYGEFEHLDKCSHVRTHQVAACTCGFDKVKDRLK